MRPELVAEVRYDKVQGNRFRHGSRFIRFRDDKDPDQCTWREVQAGRARKDDPTFERVCSASPAHKGDRREIGHAADGLSTRCTGCRTGLAPSSMSQTAVRVKTEDRCRRTRWRGCRSDGSARRARRHGDRARSRFDRSTRISSAKTRQQPEGQETAVQVAADPLRGEHRAAERDAERRQKPLRLSQLHRRTSPQLLSRNNVRVRAPAAATGHSGPSRSS